MIRKPEPLVSVVTPVYNGEKFLAECIESVLDQTYENWEYNIVDNCSKDRTLAIAQHYAEQDDRIRVSRNSEFLAIMPNWNNALRQISVDSKYCKVVHADDVLLPDCIREMVMVAEANPTVGLVSAYRLNGNRVDLDGLPYPSQCVTGWEICRRSLLDATFYVFGSPSSLLLRSDLIRNRKPFYQDHIYADVEACFNVLQEADFGFVHQVLTYTRLHKASQTSQHQSLKTGILGKLTILTKYGPLCLNSEEYQTQLGQTMKRYYRFLGWSILQRREEAFWAYHQDWLEALGISLSYRQLAQGLIKELYIRSITCLIQPKTTIRRLTKKMGSGSEDAISNQAKAVG